MYRATPFLLAALIVLEGACGRNPAYYVDKGDKLYAKGSYADAALNYRKSIQKDPSYGPAYYQLGLAEIRLNKAPDAYAALSRAADLLPNREDVKVTLADLALASYLADRRRPEVLYKKVDKIADQLLAKNANSYPGLRLKAHLAASNRNFPDAEELYRRANDIKPMQPDVMIAWVQTMLLDGHSEQGEQLATQFLEQNKTYLPMYDLLYRNYVQTNRLEDAERILKTRGENNPKDPGSLLELAAFYAARHREDEMKATLQRLLDDSKSFPQGRLLVGDLYLRLQRWDDALAEYNTGAQANPKDKVIYLKRVADVWLSQGKGEQADQVLDEILAAKPDDEAAKGVRASLLLSKPSPENIQKAVAMFQGLADKNPDNAVWQFNLGRALVASGDPERARAHLQEAIKLRRDFVPPRVLLAEISEAKRDYRGLLQYTTEAVALNPRLTRMRLLHAVSLLNTGDQVQGRSELRQLEQEFPQDPGIQLELGAVDLNQDHLPEAEQRFRKLLAEGKVDFRATVGLVRTLIAEKHPDTALSLLQEEVRQSPQSVQLRALLASTEMQEGKRDLALAEYQHLASDAPNSPQVQLELGRVYREQGDVSNAIVAFEKAGSLAPNDPTPLALLGECLSYTGQKAQALDIYRRALQMKPDNAVLMNATAYLMVETGGSLDEALKLAQKAVASNEQQPNFSDTLGWIYFKKDLNDSAVQVFRTLTKNNPENATFHYHFGMALLKKGDKRTAEAELKTALAKKPSGEVRQQIETALQKIG
ncbi:MAG TPA: tetratricopeptide repeat protein [Bryobacteraceae bacterium]|nr:tetratricopeptide repeat protein [Bryobacteraceae bacterium]